MCAPDEYKENQRLSANLWNKKSLICKEMMQTFYSECKCRVFASSLPALNVDRDDRGLKTYFKWLNSRSESSFLETEIQMIFVHKRDFLREGY